MQRPFPRQLAVTNRHSYAMLHKLQTFTAAPPTRSYSPTPVASPLTLSLPIRSTFVADSPLLINSTQIQHNRKIRQLRIALHHHAPPDIHSAAARNTRTDHAPMAG
ncbi:MAG: hypothetical protein ACKO2L_20635 [Planctomycetaceae bacterium]